MVNKIYNVEHFDENMATLREMYSTNPKSVSNAVAKTVKELKKQKEGIKDIDIDVLSKVVFAVVLFIIGIVRTALFGFEEDFVSLYICGMIFFIAGFFIGCYVKGIGIVFLFSHGMTGLGIMVGASILSLESLNPILSDLPHNLEIYFIVTALVLVVATITTIIHNLSDNFKANKMHIIYIMIMYAVGIGMLELFPLALGL